MIVFSINITRICFAVAIMGGFAILFLNMFRIIFREEEEREEEILNSDRLKIIEYTYKDGHIEYQVEGKMYVYYDEVLKYQFAILVCRTLEEAKERLEKAKNEILAKELICKKEIK